MEWLGAQDHTGRRELGAGGPSPGASDLSADLDLSPWPPASMEGGSVL